MIQALQNAVSQFRPRIDDAPGDRQQEHHSTSIERILLHLLRPGGMAQRRAMRAAHRLAVRAADVHQGLAAHT